MLNDMPRTALSADVEPPISYCHFLIRCFLYSRPGFLVASMSGGFLMLVASKSCKKFSSSRCLVCQIPILTLSLKIA